MIAKLMCRIFACVVHDVIIENERLECVTCRKSVLADVVLPHKFALNGFPV